jgi:hypothetical protein
MEAVIEGITGGSGWGTAAYSTLVLIADSVAGVSTGSVDLLAEVAGVVARRLERQEGEQACIKYA